MFRPDHRPSQPVAILGGGIGGLATALALHRVGIGSVVFERAPELREIGAGLLLTPNACAVLGKLGVLDALADRGLSTPHWDILDRRGRRLQRLRPAAMGCSPLSTRRSDLQHVLLAALPVDVVRLGHEVVGIGPSPDGVDVSFADGSTIRAPLVVASDGARSTARQVLWPARRLRDQGYVGWRAVVRGIPSGWADGHVSESWGRGQRFGIAAVSDHETYWYASANSPPGSAEPATGGADDADDVAIGLDHPRALQADLLRRFAGWHAPIEAMIADTPPGTIMRHAIADARPSWRWTADGRAALVGDAAHPLTPNLGQGAAMALEDAWVLARCLAAGSSARGALLAYERARRGRLAVVWAASRAVGWAIQSPWAGVVGVRDATLRATPDGLASRALSALFTFDER